MNHTPAPWFVNQAPGGHPTIFANSALIAAIREAPACTPEQAAANARLIAAAPDLLEACKTARHHLEMGEKTIGARNLHATLTAVIEQAEGAQHESDSEEPDTRTIPPAAISSYMRRNERGE